MRQQEWNSQEEWDMRRYIFGTGAIPAGATRQEEWDVIASCLSGWFRAPDALPEPTGVHKRNTKPFEYPGCTLAEAVKLSDREVRRRAQRRPTQLTPDEYKLLKAYWKWKLSNAGESEERGKSDYLSYGYGGIAAADPEVLIEQIITDSATPLNVLVSRPVIRCGSIECRPEKWVFTRGDNRERTW